MEKKRICKCSHTEGAHLWAGQYSDCRAAGCRCQVYQMAPRDDADRRDMDAQAAVLRRVEG